MAEIDHLEDVPTTESPVSAPSLDEQPRELLDALGYAFDDCGLLALALTHRSFCSENGDVESNERLEFLGDAVLGLAITDSLFHAQPDQPEGLLAKARAQVVSTSGLAEAARRIGVGSMLKLGRGEAMSGGRDKDSILADAMEAIIAAVYLDGGWQAARQLVVRHLSEAASSAQIAPGRWDYKTRLQELAAEQTLPLPKYSITSDGPDHDLTFIALVTVGGVTGTGEGSSKKQAQQRAAEAALRHLDAEDTEKTHRTPAGSGQSDQTPATVRSGGTP